MRDYWAILKNNTFQVKRPSFLLGNLYKKLGYFFIPTSGHTGTLCLAYFREKIMNFFSLKAFTRKQWDKRQETRERERERERLKMTLKKPRGLVSEKVTAALASVFWLENKSIISLICVYFTHAPYCFTKVCFTFASRYIVLLMYVLPMHLGILSYLCMFYLFY